MSKESLEMHFLIFICGVFRVGDGCVLADVTEVHYMVLCAASCLSGLGTKLTSAVDLRQEAQLFKNQHKRMSEKCKSL